MSRTEDLNLEEQSLKNYVKISAMVHIAILLFFSVKATFFSEAPIAFEQAIRVDIVGLPEKATELAPAPAPAAAPEKPKLPDKAPEAPVAKTESVKTKPLPKLKDPDAINLEKSKSKQKQALAKLKQMEALEKIQKQLESDSKLKAAQAASQVKYKGNVLSAGTELTGVNKLQAETYIGDVHRHITDNWSLPEYLKKRQYRTDVLVRFDEAGNILGKEVIRSSGNPVFDDFVLAAIQKSSPVPAPPAKFSRIASVEGFLFRFSHD
jgi:colicin import membrane protein